MDSPILQLYLPEQPDLTLWLAVPASLASEADPTFVKTNARNVVRYYFQGSYKDGLEHAKKIGSEVAASGKTLSGTVWVTPLSLWQNTPRGIAEYWAELN